MQNSDTTPSRRYRIAFCITDLDAGGAEKALVQIATRLPASLWEVRVYCLGPEAELVEPLRKKGIQVTCYGATSSRSLGVFSWLKNCFKEFQPDLVQSFLFHANLVARVAGKLAGVPIIVSGHRVAEREKNWHLWGDRLTKSLVTHHVCVSRGVADHLQKRVGLRREQLSVIPNGVEIPPTQDRTPEQIRLEFGLDDQTQIVLAAGRLHPQKGFAKLIQAFSGVSAKLPQAVLFIAGEGGERPVLESLIDDLKLHVRVRLIGHRADLLMLMRSADLFVLSSEWEGMPNVVLEAMASGLPVISSSVEGIEELIQHEVTGFIVTPLTAETLMAEMVRILSLPELRKNVSHAAQDVVCKMFTWNSVVEEYQQLYEKLLNATDSAHSA